MLDYFLLAYHNLKKRGIRSWLTLLGVFIGVLAVISLITLGNGLKLAVNSQFGISSTEVITVQAGGVNSFGTPGSGAVKRLTKDDVEAIERLSSVDVAIGRNIETFKIEFNNKVEFRPGFGLAEGIKRKFDYEIQDLEVETGRLLEDGDTKKVILGNDYLHKDKSGFDKAIEVGNKILINNQSFKVVGILKKKGSFILDNAIIINDHDLDTIADNGNYVDLIAVKVKNKDLMKKAQKDIEKLLRKRRDVKEGEEDFEVSTPQARLKTINSILNAIQIFIIIIASISILVGAIGIINTMTTSVLERKKEIGIMKAIGARNEQVFMQFFIESGLMGLIGGLLGIIGGIIIGYFGTMGLNNFFGSEAAPEISILLIILTLIGSFLVGALAGIIPAMQAANQNPVEALRG